MGDSTINGVQVTHLRIIPGDAGHVMHALKASEESFSEFGEAYFSTVKEKAVKGWKRHRVMHSNLIVPEGQVRFVLYDDRLDSPTNGIIQEVLVGPSNYVRLTIPPMIWFAFQGLTKDTNLILNIASVQHDPDECDQLPLHTEKISFDKWK